MNAVLTSNQTVQGVGNADEVDDSTGYLKFSGGYASAIAVLTGKDDSGPAASVFTARIEAVGKSGEVVLLHEEVFSANKQVTVRLGDIPFWSIRSRIVDGTYTSGALTVDLTFFPVLSRGDENVG